MKSFTGKIASGRGWVLLLALLLGAGMMISACGDEEVPAPTTPAPPPPAPPPAPEPEPPPEPPATPTGLMVSGATESSISWTWTAVEGATGYVVQASADEMFDDTVLGNPETVLFNGVPFTTETSYTATDLEAETGLYVRVAAAAGTPDAPLVSSFSTHVTGMTTAVPLALAPANLRIKTRGSDFIEWEWDAVEGVDGYQSQFSDSSTFPEGQAGRESHQGMANTTRRVSNLDAESDGYLRVRTYTGTVAEPTFGMWTEGSMSSTTEPPPAVQLDEPDNVETSGATRESITVSWDEVDDAESYEVDYRVAGAGGNWNDADCGEDGVVGDIQCVVTDLDEGTEYEFRVRAIPDEDDTTLEPSGWAEAEGTTIGAREPEVSGGMGDLNVTWKSDGESITFSWEPMAGTTYEWKEIGTDAATRLAALDDANPCSGDTFFDSPTGSGANFSYKFENVSRGDIRGLCVRIDDDDLDDDQKALSWRWGATTPVAPTAADAATIDTRDEKQVATALDWTAVMLKKGFEWELRLVADSGRGDGELDGAPSAKSVQNACDAGTFVDQGDADLDLSINYTWDGAISAYTGYLLCLKYANTRGSTAWGVPGDTAIDEIYTPPARPPGPRYEASRSTTAPDGSTRVLVWTVANRNSENVPREASDFEAKYITYPVRYDHDTNSDNSLVGTPAPTSCVAADITAGPRGNTSGTNPWTSADATETNDLDGIRVASAAITIPENDAQNLGVRLCVRATKDSAGNDLNGPWVLGGATTITKKPAS